MNILSVGAWIVGAAVLSKCSPGLNLSPLATAERAERLATGAIKGKKRNREGTELRWRGQRQREIDKIERSAGIRALARSGEP